MRTVSYKSVLRGVLAREGGGNLRTVDATDPLVARAIEYIADRFRSAWEYYVWPEIFETEKRYFRAEWDFATTYAIGDEVWFPGYYSITVSGAGNAQANGEYIAVDTYNGRPRYYKNGDTSSYVIRYDGAAYWELYNSGAALWQYSSAAADFPWEASWADEGGGSPAPTVTEDAASAPVGAGYYTALVAGAGGSPLDTDRWEPITELRRLVDFNQTGKTAFEACVGAWDRDPDTDKAAKRLHFAIAADGVVLPADYTGVLAWLKLRRKCPDLAAVVDDAAAAYAIGDVVYFDSIGDVYECLEATTTGQTPLTHAAKWRVIEFPMIFARAVKAGALADWQRSDGEGSATKTRDSEDRFVELLDEQVWQLTKLQGQTGRTDFEPAP